MGMSNNQRVASPLNPTKEYQILDQFVGKKVKIVTGPEGEETQYGLTVTCVEGTLISVKGSQNEVRAINTASSNFFEISIQEN